MKFFMENIEGELVELFLKTETLDDKWYDTYDDIGRVMVSICRDFKQCSGQTELLNIKDKGNALKQVIRRYPEEN